VLAPLALVLAGCGGGKSNQAATTSVTVPHLKTVVLGKVAYEHTMKRLGTQLATSIEGLFPLVEAQPGTDIGKATLKKLEATRAVVTTVRSRIAAIIPPAPIRTEHRQLLQGISALGTDLDGLINLEKRGSSRAWGTYARFRSLRAIGKARTAIEQKGYAIG
jgi:hypothetical protein